MINEKLKKDMEFIVAVDKMKSIFRQTSIIGEDRREDDAQHSWHISLMAMTLGEYANDEVDVYKVIKMLLTHDLVEIYAGDTFCYDQKANLDKKEREIEAANKIYGMLDEEKGKEMRALWDEFEKMETKEAIFAAAMDRFQPILNNYYNKGGTWKKYNVSKEAVYKRMEPIKRASKELWAYTEFMIENAIKEGMISE